MCLCRAPLADHTLATHLQACSWGMAWTWGRTGVGGEAPCPCILQQQQLQQRQLRAGTHKHHMGIGSSMAISHLPIRSLSPAECLSLGGVLVAEATWQSADPLLALLVSPVVYRSAKDRCSAHAFWQNPMSAVGQHTRVGSRCNMVCCGRVHVCQHDLLQLWLLDCM